MAQIRVLVVDDSVVVRRLVAHALAQDPGIEVVGTAANGKIALSKVEQLAPDLVTLDIEMPVMDGLETLLELRRIHPRLPVVMFSTLTERGASATLRALECGADDYVTKPSNVGSMEESRAAVAAQLVPKIHALGRRRQWSGPAGRTRPPTAPSRPSGASRSFRTRLSNRVDLLVIGSSTGGPDALTQLLGRLPADLPVPVLIAQHMPPVFTRQFADRLDRKVALHVSEAVEGEALGPGRALIAPGDYHLRVAGTPAKPVAVLDQGPQENFCRPAVDVLFRSAAGLYGGHVLAVVLTGMGSDGAKGSLVIDGAGGQVIAQDEESSVVWGMPGAVVGAEAAHEVLPLDAIPDAITTRCRFGRAPHAPATRPQGALR